MESGIIDKNASSSLFLYHVQIKLKKEAHTLRSSAETSVSNADSVEVVTAVLIRQEAPCYLLPNKEARREQTTE